jgi:zinc protease
MVMKKKVATDIGVGYEAERLGEGMLTITSLPVDAKPASFQKAQNAAMAVLQAVARGEIDEKTLQRSKNSMKASAIYARDSLMTPAMVVGEGLVLGHSVDMIETWPEKIMAVTAKDLQAAAALLTPHTMVTGRLYPAPKTADNKTVH